MMIKKRKAETLALATALTLTLTVAGCTAQSTQEKESAETAADAGGAADGKTRRAAPKMSKSRTRRKRLRHLTPNIPTAINRAPGTRARP